jgi:hypothetical protein
VPRARWGLRGAATIGSRVHVRWGDIPAARYVSAMLVRGERGRNAFGTRRGAGDDLRKTNRDTSLRTLRPGSSVGRAAD